MQKKTNFLKNIALTLLISRFEHFVDEQAVNSIQSASTPDTSKGKINLCETLKTIRQSISRYAFQSKKGELFFHGTTIQNSVKTGHFPK